MAADEEKTALGNPQHGSQTPPEKEIPDEFASSSSKSSDTASKEKEQQSQQQPDLEKSPSDVRPPPEVVPRLKRRGLFGSLTIVPEVVNAYHYPNSTKWMMTVLVAMAGVTSSTGSSIFYPALNEMAVDLHTTQTITNLSLAFYMLAMAFSPLWWSAFSEQLGRRTIYIISFTLFVVFSVISAVSVNIAMLIVFRILSGGAAASVQAVGAGTAADVWEPKERGKAMGLFYIGPLCGPGLAPVIGGALTQGFGWRSTLWFLVIFGGVILLLILFFLPETVSRDKEPKEKPKLTPKLIVKKFVDPLLMVKLFRYPSVLMAVYSAAISFGALFVINVTIQSAFAKRPYNFGTIEVGLLYLAPTLGYAVSSLLGGRWIDYIMKREAHKAGRYDENGKPKFLPEDRLKENILLGAVMYPCGMIWYGWVVENGVHWIVSCIANFFFGLGMMLVFGAVTTVLTEFTPKKSSSGVALNNFMRNIFSCIATVVTQPLLDAMGVGWLCTMVGLIALFTTLAAILALKIKGPAWRVAMDRKLDKPGGQ